MKCQTCEKYPDCFVNSSLTWPCGAYVSMQHPSNGDRIRSMSDRELAELLTKTYIEGEYAMMIKMQGHSPSQVAKQAAIYHCAPIVFELLKKPAKEGNNGEK